MEKMKIYKIHNIPNTSEPCENEINRVKLGVDGLLVPYGGRGQQFDTDIQGTHAVIGLHFRLRFS